MKPLVQMLTILVLFLASACSTSGDNSAKASPGCGDSQSVSPRAIAGNSTDIFIAKLGAKQSPIEGTFGSIDIYDAVVSSSLMGNANGEVRVGLPSVTGGSDVCRYGTSLISGKVYMLATSLNPATGVYSVALFPTAAVELSDADLGTIGTPSEPEAVRTMREAVKSPIYPHM